MDSFYETKVIILQIESWILYYTTVSPNKRPVTLEGNIYWSDHINLKGSGPFKTAYEAGKHYESVAKQRRNMATLAVVNQKDPENIIQVNFKARKRILTE